MKIKLFGRTFEIKAQLESLPGIGNDSAWANYLSGKGYRVSTDVALKIATVIRCVDIVAKTLPTLGCNLFRDTGDGKIRAKAHPVFSLLKYLPNPETTAYEFWHMYIFNLMLTTGAYAKIKRDQNGFITELWNIPTRNVSMYRNQTNGERYIVVHGKADKVTLREGEFMFTPGLRINSTDADDFLNIAAEVLGLTYNLNNYARDFFENGSNLGGFIEYPNPLNEKAFKNFRDSWEASYSSVKNQHKWAILEAGFKLHELGKNPNDAQALESRKFQVIEVCRMFGVPPHKVFDLERATFNNIEEQNIEFVQDAIDPMSVRIEQTIYKDLLTAHEQKRYFAKFNTNALLRGNIAARTTYYNTMRQNGAFSANRILDLEDMDLISKEDGGDELLVNGNMISLKHAKDNLPKALQQGQQNKGGTPA